MADTTAPLIKLGEPHAKRLDVWFGTGDLSGIKGAPLYMNAMLTVTWQTLYLEGYQLRVVQQHPQGRLKLYFYSPNSTFAFRINLPATYAKQSLQQIAEVLDFYTHDGTLYHSTRGAQPAQADVWQVLKGSNDALAAQLAKAPKPLQSAEIINLEVQRLLRQQRG